MEQTLDAAFWQAKGMTYAQYLELIDKLLAEGKTTGTDQSPERLEKARLNRQRMKRLDKTYHPSENMVAAARSRPGQCLMFVLTEGWCGDASQLVPMLHQFATCSEGRIRDLYFLRDEHPELMDLFLTNGTRSIPKAVFVDALSGRVLSVWGPRPASISERYAALKTRGEHSKDELHTQLHKWYAEDKGASFEQDIRLLMERVAAAS